MNCYIHPDRPVVSYCRSCGRALCTACQRPAEGTVFCSEHAPMPAQSSFGGAYSGSPYTTTAEPSGSPGGTNPYGPGQAPFTPPIPTVSPVQTSPGLAFLLGWIPGVGAIYNGQYIKGLVHAGIFGLLITLINANENGATVPFVAMVLATFCFYMPFEAYHTAKRRQLGMPVEEWSSLSRGPLPTASGRTPVGPIVLIAIGVLFLLDTMNLIEFRQIGRFWPVILIAAGVSMLYSRISPSSARVIYPQAPYVPPAPQPSAPASPAPATAGSEFMETGHE